MLASENLETPTDDACKVMIDYMILSKMVTFKSLESFIKTCTTMSQVIILKKLFPSVDSELLSVIVRKFPDNIE